jgi:hyperosmotically inducible protein
MTTRLSLQQKGELMKTVNRWRALGMALCLAVASSAYAQSTDATAPSDTAASARTDRKAIKKMDHKLSLDVRRALSKTKGMVVKNIFVRARSGAIILSGSVPDVALISKAAEVAAGVPGVRSVTNRLSVQEQNYY